MTWPAIPPRPAKGVLRFSSTTGDGAWGTELEAQVLAALKRDGCVVLTGAAQKETCAQGS